MSLALLEVQDVRPWSSAKGEALADMDIMPFDCAAWLRSLRVRAMTPEAKGCYVDLLVYGWRHKGIPARPVELRALLGLSSSRFRRIWDQVGPMWENKPGEPGRLINDRQERERARCIASREAAAERQRRRRLESRVTDGSCHAHEGRDCHANRGRDNG